MNNFFTILGIVLAVDVVIDLVTIGILWIFRKRLQNNLRMLLQKLLDKPQEEEVDDEYDEGCTCGYPKAIRHADREVCSECNGTGETKVGWGQTHPSGFQDLNGWGLCPKCNGKPKENLYDECHSGC